MLRQFSIVFVLCLMAGGVFSQNQIKWVKDLDTALKTAKAENKPVLICVNMDKEVANDRMVKEHYKDPKIVAKSAEFVCMFISKFRHNNDEGNCPRCGHITCDQHMLAERKVREAYFESNEVIAPQHIFLNPKGELVKSKIYFLTKTELLSLCDSVLMEIFPERYKKEKKEEGDKPKEGEASEETPEEPKEEKAAPETPADFKEAILEEEDSAEIKKLARELVKRKKDEEAQLVLSDLLADKKAPVARLNGLLLAYGLKGNKAGVEKVTPFLKHKDPQVRTHAAVALEDIADKSALKAIGSRLKSEKEEVVRKNLVRALGASAKGNKKYVGALTKLLRDKSTVVQRNAAVALGGFKKGGKAEKALMQMAFSGGGGGRGGRGGGGFGRRMQTASAAYYGLAQMGSKKAKKKLEETIEKSNEFMAAGLERILPAFEGKFDPTNSETVRWRRTSAADKIARDLDPAGAGGMGDNNGRRGRNGRDGEEGRGRGRRGEDNSVLGD